MQCSSDVTTCIYKPTSVVVSDLFCNETVSDENGIPSFLQTEQESSSLLNFLPYFYKTWMKTYRKEGSISTLRNT